MGTSTNYRLRTFISAILSFVLLGAISASSDFSTTTDSCMADISVIYDGSGQSATLTVHHSGSPNSSVFWSDSSTIETITVFESGDYCVEVLTETGCYVSACISVNMCNTFIVQEPFSGGGFILYAESDDPNSSVSNTFIWDNGSLEQSTLVQETGNYCVMATTPDGCQSNACIYVEVTPPADSCVAYTYSFPDTINNVTLVGVDPLGDGPFVYVWSNGADTREMTVSTSGEYCVTVTDGNGCSATGCVNAVIEETNHTLSFTAPSDVVLYLDNQCYADTSQVATGDVNDEYSETCNEQLQATYIDQVSSSCGGSFEIARVWTLSACGTSVSHTQYISYIDTIAPVVQAPADVTLQMDTNCGADISPSSTGEATVFDNCTYNIIATHTDQVIEDPNGGTCGGDKEIIRTWTATDDCGNVSQAIQLIILEAPADQPVDSCFTTITQVDQGNGQFKLIAETVGEGPFELTWHDSLYQDGDYLYVEQSGTYCVSVADANGCWSDACATVEVPTTTEPGDTCSTWIEVLQQSDGRVKIWGHSTGTGPFNHTWSTGNTAISQSGEAFTYVTESGEYCIEVIDANQCVSTHCVTVEVPVQEPADSCYTTIIPVDQGNGQFKLIAETVGQGPFALTWHDSLYQDGDYLYVEQSGTYCVSVADANGCYSDACITVEVPTTVDSCDVWIELIPQSDGSVKAWAHGTGEQLTYQWNGVGSNVSSSEPYFYATESGTYCALVYTASGCQAEACIDIEVQVQEPTDSCFTTITQVDQGNGQFKLIAETAGQGPFALTWHDSLYQDGDYLYVEQSGTYCVSVVDANGCWSDACATVEVPTTTEPGDTCSTWIEVLPQSDGRVKIWGHSTGTGPFNHTWSTGNTAISQSGEAFTYVTESGEYCIEVIDANQCVSTHCVTVEVPVQEPSDSCYTTIIPVDQGNGQFKLIAETVGQGPFALTWHDSLYQDGDYLYLEQSGTYCVSVIDANGCSSDACTTVDIPVDTCAVYFYIDSLIGYTEVVAEPTGLAPFEYMWSNGNSGNALILEQSQDVCVTVTDANGCAAVKCQYIEVSIAPCEVAIDRIDSDSSDAILLMAFGNDEETAYSWSTGDTSQSIEITESGEYCVIAISSTGCTAEKCVYFEVDDVFCETTIAKSQGNTPYEVYLEVQPTGLAPFEYQWINGATDPFFVAQASGSYCVIVVDARGCVSEACIEVQVAVPTCDSYIYVAETTDDHVTIGVETDGHGPFEYFWSNGEQSEKITVSTSKEYCVEVIDALGCISWDCQYIEVENYNTCSVEIEVTEIDDRHKISANPSGVAPFTYEWAHGDTTRFFYPELDGKYCVTVIDAEGCVSEMCLETEGITPGIELEAYPSPARDDFHVVIDSELEFEGRVDIRDIRGNLLFTKSIDITEGIQSLNFSSDEYPAGVFFVNIIRGSHIETIRIVKANGRN